MIVAGVMSGTSADGIDVALVKISAKTAAPSSPRALPRITLLAHRAHRFPRALRTAILAAMAGQSQGLADAPNTTTAELARLNWRLGLTYAEAVQATIRDTKIEPALIGCHGQTVYHQGSPFAYAGRRFSCTWQLGEPALIAAACGVPVVSNFRPADMALGGQGAPLVPLFDYAYFVHPDARPHSAEHRRHCQPHLHPRRRAARTSHRLRHRSRQHDHRRARCSKLFSKPYDRNGRIAARGKVLEPVLTGTLREKFFRLAPPKSAGREQFGAVYAAEFLAACRRHSQRPEDAIASATALTAESIADVAPHLGPASHQVRPHRPHRLRRRCAQRHAPRHAPQVAFQTHSIKLTTADALGLPSEAKEAAAFALLAYQTWHHQPGNVPSATGASRPAILGQITYA